VSQGYIYVGVQGYMCKVIYTFLRYIPLIIPQLKHVDMLLRCFGALTIRYLTPAPLITHCPSARHSQPAAHSLARVISAVTSSSLHTVSDLGSTTQTSSSSTALKEVSDAVFQEQISRSFVKVPSPAEAALRQIVIAAPEGPTDLDLRAYHVGGCWPVHLPVVPVVSRPNLAHSNCLSAKLQAYFCRHTITPWYRFGVYYCIAAILLVASHLHSYRVNPAASLTPGCSCV
jgi:hypothetical protein